VEQALTKIALAGATAVLLLLSTGPTLPHASLLSAVPADRSIVATAPEEFRLVFNEPVSPLVLKLIASERKPIFLEQYRAEGRALIVRAPPSLNAGTYLFSWRVISTDGHPIGGSLIFSIEAPSPGLIPQTGDAYDPQARTALWVVRLAIYFGLFIGVGGAFGRSCLLDPTGATDRPSRSIVRASLLLGLTATALSIGLQGLDALGAPLTQLGQPIVWGTGFNTSWGNSAIIAGLAVLAGLCTMAIGHRRLARGLALIGLVGIGLALSASGHASAASPEVLTRPAVFLHAIGIAIWTGSLLPLAGTITQDGSQGMAALRRFSHAIPFILAIIILSGVVLAVVQVEHVGALWSTDFGRVLVAKLAVLALVLVIAAWNRFALTRRINRGETDARLRLVRLIFIEVMLVAIIFALATTWRFTPPPRALAAAAAEPSILSLHTGSVVAELTFTPGRAGPVAVSMIIMTGNFGPLDAKEVTLTIANPAAGVEPIARTAYKPGDGTWRIDGLTIPLPGFWSAQLDILMPDATMATLEGELDIRP
jgi:copper transport protein